MLGKAVFADFKIFAPDIGVKHSNCAQICRRPQVVDGDQVLARGAIKGIIKGLRRQI